MKFDTIKETRKRFDAELHTEEYKKIHSDSKQLDNLLNLADFLDGEKYMDLGTGNGYIAFEMASRFKKVSVEGLDIAENSIITNREIANDKEIDNISFSSYDGTVYPYANHSFSGSLSRYAFHHFPDVKKSIAEIHRVLKVNGFFLLSDPLTYSKDKNGFIDKFQILKKDGHIHFYYENEITELFQQNGFKKEETFYSYVTYPREYSNEYDKLLNSVPDEIQSLYQIKKIQTEVYITVKVMNILFRKL